MSRAGRCVPQLGAAGDEDDPRGERDGERGGKALRRVHGGGREGASELRAEDEREDEESGEGDAEDGEAGGVVPFPDRIEALALGDVGEEQCAPDIAEKCEDYARAEQHETRAERKHPELAEEKRGHDGGLK